MFLIYGSILTLLLFFITSLLVTSRQKNTNTILPALLMIALAVGVTPFAFPDLADITAFAFFTFGPILLFYIKERSGIPISTNAWKSPHFFPFFISLLLFPGVILYEKNEFIFKFYEWFYLVANIHVAIYLIYLINFLRKRFEEVKQKLSNTDKLNFKWNYLLLSFFLFYFFIFLPIETVFYLLGFMKAYTIFYQITSGLTALYIFLLGVFSLKNPNIVFLLDNKEKGKNNTVSKDDEVRFHSYMKDEKPYLDCDLTLSALADSMGISEKSVSRIINNSDKKNFYDFISALRIEYYNQICRLEANSNKTILELAMESGFSCKSTFNANYKRLTGQTPSQFRKGKQLLRSTI